MSQSKRKLNTIELTFKRALISRSSSGKRGVYIIDKNEFLEIEDYFYEKLVPLGYKECKVDQSSDFIAVVRIK